MTILPPEIIDLVLSFVDPSTLFESCQVCHSWRQLSYTHLQRYAQNITVRLWICQPGTTSHKPLDFDWQAKESRSDKLVFSFQPKNGPSSFTKPSDTNQLPHIDGCTVIVHHADTRRRQIFSLSYNPIALPLSAQDQSSQWIQYEPLATSNLIYKYPWHLSYDCEQGSNEKMNVVPRQFICSMDFVNPILLEASSRGNMARIPVTASPKLPSPHPSKEAKSLKLPSMESALAVSSSPPVSPY
ncbi:uncharacterized protein BYT42DRAFT_553287 [Radiomyces spectabilis]|uniref:uncharacterized protein n=1 Tax=Radiomyces spectabilis TaxID=64574 RepID=UPI00221F4321|nr:uncharacterized protein BYT42DRAFT_553287 [Radiomyces spectabilis]KAI8394080.1 hypothetical protein BYT42DRAFT_553287 [Radiomyces spectabilis]